MGPTILRITHLEESTFAAQTLAAGCSRPEADGRKECREYGLHPRIFFERGSCKQGSLEQGQCTYTSKLWTLRQARIPKPETKIDVAAEGSILTAYRACGPEGENFNGTVLLLVAL